MAPLFTLTTDYGSASSYPAQVKAIILSAIPDARIVDVTHDVPAFDVLAAALILEAAVPWFPRDAIHLAVVDPGVGTSRRPLAARLGEQFFVGPDNGLLTLLLEDAGRNAQPVECVHLTKPQYWLPRISSSFHGRDIFAPVAAHLSLGVPLADLGQAITDPLRLQIPAPRRSDTGWKGEIIHIDAFGNLATNLRSEHLQGRGKVEVQIAGLRIRGMVRSFGEGTPGQYVALIDSAGALSICQVNSSAERSLGAKLGDGVEIKFVT